MHLTPIPFSSSASLSTTLHCQILAIIKDLPVLNVCMMQRNASLFCSCCFGCISSFCTGPFVTGSLHLYCHQAACASLDQRNV